MFDGLSFWTGVTPEEGVKMVARGTISDGEG